MDGYAVTLTDSRGEQWALTDGSPGRSGVWLMGPPDLQSQVEVGARASVRQIGGERTGWAIDPMIGTLKLGLWDEHGGGLLEPWSQLASGLSMFKDSHLQVVTPGHGDAETRIRVDGSFPMPEVSPATYDLRTLEIDVPVVSHEGSWRGDRKVSSDAKTTWINRGDLPARGTVRWAGAGVTIRIQESSGRFDTGVVTLPVPPPGETAELDLDPAVAARVTVNGDPHPGLWRAMRARIFPEILPGHNIIVALSGDSEIDLSARLTTPWRWSE